LEAIRATARLAMLVPLASTTSLTQNLPSDVTLSGALRGGADAATGDYRPISSPQDEGAYVGQYNGAEVRAVAGRPKKTNDGQEGGEQETRYFESKGIDLNELKRRVEQIEQESQDGKIFGVKLPPRVEKAAGKLKERIDDLQQAINFSALPSVRTSGISVCIGPAQCVQGYRLSLNLKAV
jgi:hypothetical protein